MTYNDDQGGASTAAVLHFTTGNDPGDEQFTLYGSGCTGTGAASPFAALVAAAAVALCLSRRRAAIG